MQESEYESTRVIYILIQQYKYIVITKCDLNYINITLPGNIKVRFTR